MYSSPIPPYEHQVRALSKAEGRESFAFLMGMRTGKTKVVIDEWGGLVERNSGVQDLLVTAPAGCYRGWEDELALHLPPAMWKETLIHRWVSGSGKMAKRQLEWFLNQIDSRPRVLLMNIEALSSVAGARATVEAFVRPGRAYFGVDESTTIKAPDSERGVFVGRIGRTAPIRRILTGLVAPRSPLDLFGQFEFLDPGILGFKNYGTFKAHHAVTRQMHVSDFTPDAGVPADGIGPGRTIEVVVGYKNEGELTEKIANHHFRVKLEDCYDVPKSAYVARYVEHTDEQARIYKDLKSQAFAQLEEGGHITATRVVSRMLRLHQLNCGYLVDDDKVKREVKENRTKALIDVLEEYDGKAIIWCSYDHNVYKIVAALEERFGGMTKGEARAGRLSGRIARYWGGNRSTRDEEEKRFKEDPLCRYMVATPAAGGRGKTWWRAASLAVYYSNTDNLEHRDQSEERIKGMGKEAPCTYVDLIVPGTVDEPIVKSLREKMEMAAAITGENVREWLI